MRFPIGLTRLPLPQFTWASIDKHVENPHPAPAEPAIELSVKEDDNA
jgi:hypothetical protein